MFNIEAEQALLACLFIKNDLYYDIAENLQPEHFYDPLHADIYGLIGEKVSSGEAATPPTLKALMANNEALKKRGGATYLAELAMTYAPTAYAKDYAAAIRDAWSLRRGKQICDEFNAALATEGKSPYELLADLASAVDGIQEKQDKTFLSVADVGNNILAELSRNTSCYSTGYKCLDNSMAGGLFPSKAYAICARKKQGKTLLSGAISHNLNKSGVKHLFIGCEMTPEEIHQRALSYDLGINALCFVDPAKRHNPDFLTRVADGLHKIPKNMHYVNGAGMTFNKLKRTIVYGCEKMGIKGFVLDYIQLVRGQRKGQSEPEFMDEVAQWIAEVVRKYNIFGLIIAQINQQGNVRGSESIRLAFDQVYQLVRCETDSGDILPQAYLEMMDTRYTDWCDVGGKLKPALELNVRRGPKFEEL